MRRYFFYRTFDTQLLSLVIDYQLERRQQPECIGGSPGESESMEAGVTLGV